MSDVSVSPARSLDHGSQPVRFARGWHCLGLSETFRDGRPHAVQGFGTKLVVWADTQGKLNVLDGYCRHMGGDLTQARSRVTRSAAPSTTGAGVATASASRSRTPGVSRCVPARSATRPLSATGS